MREIRVMLFCLLMLSVVAIAGAQTDAHHPGAQASPPPGQQPSGMMGGMMGGMGGPVGMQMMCSMPTMVVDKDAIYVLQGDRLLKFNKNTLQLMAQAPLPTMPMGNTQAMGGGAMPTPPATPGMVGAAGAQTPMPMMPSAAFQQMLSRMQQMSPNEFDRSFLQNMMRHHAGAVAVSRLALRKAVHPELRVFAQRVISEQNGEITRFSGWLKTWYGIPMAVTPMPFDQEGLSHLQSLTGSDFETTYMLHMIMHHQMALQMAQMAEQKAEHPMLKTAAAKIISTQSAEITQLRNWLSAWYGVNG